MIQWLRLFTCMKNVGWRIFWCIKKICCPSWPCVLLLLCHTCNSQFTVVLSTVFHLWSRLLVWVNEVWEVWSDRITPPLTVNCGSFMLACQKCHWSLFLWSKRARPGAHHLVLKEQPVLWLILYSHMQQTKGWKALANFRKNFM